jgi:hypothetical protein
MPGAKLKKTVKSNCNTYAFIWNRIMDVKVGSSEWERWRRQKCVSSQRS